MIDGLAMTISSDSGSALVTLETLRRIRDELHGHSILGVSNISFGLPQREIVNLELLHNGDAERSVLRDHQPGITRR